tara:strand:+ start:1704 stop:1829 length:126 start_codon:yes stop_codon:yes gene_type:complete
MTTSYIEADEVGPYSNLDKYSYGLYISKELIILSALEAILL